MPITNLTDAGGGNMVVAATLANADHTLQIVFRYVDPDNYLMLRASSRNRAELWARQAGAWDAVPLAVSLDAYASGDRFEVRASGTRLCAYRNGSPVVSADDGRFRAATLAALDVDDPAAVSDFAVASADGPPPPVPVKLGPVAAYYPDDLRYADAEMP